MVLQRSIALVVSIFFCCLPFTVGGSVQKAGLTVPNQYQSKKDEVGNMFAESYRAYKDCAWGHDDLAPVTKGFVDDRNGWGASIVDAMDTMYIMGLEDEFNEAVKFVSHIDFNKSQTPDTTSVFETTIRYVGGLLSAYELSGENHTILLTKAREVAEKLTYAWTPTNQVLSRIPYSHVDFANDQPVVATSNIAEAGTLTLEFSTLSKHTGVDKYRKLAENAVIHIAALPAPLPGLPAQGIDPLTGLPVGSYISWGGGSDSYFEYLIKYARLSNTDNPVFVNNWLTAVDSSIKTLLKRSTVGGYAYLADYNEEKQIVHVGSHLACFYGGNWILGGKLLDNQTIIDYGLELTDACWNTYASTATRIGPEVFGYISDDGDYAGQGSLSEEQIEFYNAHGFYIKLADYILRPEVLESNFYAWRATGDEKYLRRAVSAIDSFKTFLPATVGFAGINDVNSAFPSLIDDMESFWLAEVLKYLYLTFDDPDRFSLDDYVLNTECHLFKAPAAKASYGGQVLPGKPFTAPSQTHGPLPAVSPNPLLPAPIQTIIG